MEKSKLNKETINIIRTTQRNNIDLTHIADNKANVLLSLNAIMITFLLPMVLANLDVVLTRSLYIPLAILASTCFVTIYISAIVLKPSNFGNFQDSRDPSEKFSPFFFANFYNMAPDVFYQYMNDSLEDGEMTKRHLIQDLYYVGRRLGFKMIWIRRAFNIFLTGLFFSILSTIIVFWLN